MAHRRRQAIEQLDLLITCLNFVQAATWRESRAFLEAHPELLGDDSDDAMQELGRRLTDDGQHSLALVAERHRLLLRSCKSMGLDAAFAAVGDLDTAKYGDPGPPLRLAVEMLFAASWDDLRALVDQHPEVVSDAGIAALEDIHAMMRENGDRDDIARAAQRLELLRRCREVGVAAAFADVQAEQEAADREADDWLTSFAADVQAAAAQTAACSEARSISAWDECVRAWDGLLSRASEKAAQVPTFLLVQAGMPSMLRYELSREQADLDRSERLWAAAVDRPDIDPESLDLLLPSLATVYRERYARRHLPSDRDRAIAMLDRALNGDRAAQTQWIADLAALLYSRWESGGDQVDQRRAAELARAVATRASTGSDEDKNALLRLPDRLRASLSPAAQGVRPEAAPSQGRQSRTRRAVTALGSIRRRGVSRSSAPDKPSDSPVPVDLQEPLLALLDTESWPEAAELVIRFPRLLDDDAQEHLISMVALGRLAGQDSTAALVERRRSFLLRCREVGHSMAAEQFAAEDEKLFTLVAQVLSADTPRAMAEVLATHQDLSAGLAEGYARQIVKMLRDEGSEEDARAAEQRLTYLVAWSEDDRFVVPVPDDPIRKALRTIAACLQRWGDAADAAALDQAIEAGEAARREPAYATGDAGDRANLIAQLGIVYAQRFKSQFNVVDRDTALALLDEAVRTAPTGSEAHIDARINHGVLLGELGRQMGGSGLSERAEVALRQLLDELPDDHSDRPLVMWNLADVVDDLAQRDVSRQDEAIELGERAVAITDGSSHYLPGRLDGLGVFLRHRAGLTGSTHDLRRAEALQRRAIALVQDGGAEQAHILVHLGNLLLDLFGFDADEKHLAECIQTHEQVLANQAAASWTRARALAGLGSALTVRYRRHGRPDDLRSAHEMLVRSLALDPRPEAGALDAIGTLASTMLITDGADAIDRTVTMMQDAARTAPHASAAADRLQINLASTLLIRYRLTGNEEDTDQAEAAVATVAASDRRHSADALACLGEIRVERSRRGTARASDLDRGIEDLSEALRRLETDSRRWSVQAHLAQAKAERWGRDGNDVDRVEASLEFRRVVTGATRIAPPLAVSTAGQWSEWAVGRTAWAEAGEAAWCGLTAMADLVRAQLDRDAKETWIFSAQGLAVRAALARRHLQDLPEAALALETGRALVLSEELERGRFDLGSLAASGFGDAARHYADATQRWKELLRRGQDTTSRADLAQEIERAYEEFDAAAQEIREIPGHAGFATMPSVDDIFAAATHDTIVYLAAGPNAGLALLVRGGATDVVDLPILTADALRSAAAQWADAYSRRRQDRRSWWETVDKTTTWLWDAVMGPVCAVTGAGEPLALVPTGLLGLLPLHAADRPVGPDRRYVIDEHPVRYLPNARALTEARRRAADNRAVGLLAVEDPRPSRHPVLSGAAVEVESACRRLPDGPAERFVGPAAQLAEVLEAVKTMRVLHFCCHGEADADHPLDSGLDLVDDQRLTVAAVTANKVRARLVVLSACETALVGRHLPDEVVGLPAAFLEAGAAGVVGSLWSVPEPATLAVVDEFYRRWAGGVGDEPAAALSAAQSWARLATYEELHERFPGIADFSPRRVPSVALPLWRTATPLHRAAEWSALTFVGA